jgi:hypothetical protein
MMSLNQNLIWARNSVHFTKKSLTTGASNKLSNLGIKPQMCVRMMRASPSPIKKNNMHDYIRSWAARARHFKCGNCAEHAAVAFTYLEDKGIRPIHYMAILERGDHGFVVIGRAPNSSDGNIESWGINAVVCDPWHEKNYPASQSGSNMTSIVRAKTIWRL